MTRRVVTPGSGPPVTLGAWARIDPSPLEESTCPIPTPLARGPTAPGRSPAGLPAAGPAAAGLSAAGPAATGLSQQGPPPQGYPQQNYPQQGYQQPYGAPPAEDPGKTLGIVGLVLSFFTAIIGVIISIVALRKSKKAGSRTPQP